MNITGKSFAKGKLYSKTKPLKNFKMQFFSNLFEQRKGDSHSIAFTAWNLGRNNSVLDQI